VCYHGGRSELCLSLLRRRQMYCTVALSFTFIRSVIPSYVMRTYETLPHLQSLHLHSSFIYCSLHCHIYKVCTYIVALSIVHRTFCNTKTSLQELPCGLVSWQQTHNFFETLFSCYQCFWGTYHVVALYVLYWFGNLKVVIYLLIWRKRCKFWTNDQPLVAILRYHKVPQKCWQQKI